MGYETQLIVGFASDQEYNGKNYFMVYATIDMSKLERHSALFELDWNNKEDTNQPIWEFYAPAGDGDTGINTACYGVVPKPIPIDLVIEALQTDAEDSDNRRVKWAIALLTSIEETTYDTSVLLWGH